MAILSPMITVLLIVVAAVGIGAFFLSSKKEREVRNSSGNDSNPFVHGSYNQPQKAEPVVKEVQPEPAKKEEPVYKPAQEKAFDRPAMDPSPHKASPEPVRPEPVPLKQEEPARQVSEPDLVQVVVPVESKKEPKAEPKKEFNKESKDDSIDTQQEADINRSQKLEKPEPVYKKPEESDSDQSKKDDNLGLANSSLQGKNDDADDRS